ncbi:hypothetical protein GIB67_010726 [Kingdonia uniflora]|uniref:Uncharacterized protein n=1 Tax=Kingdonia uniflora TaxID=39325 RepID=A0A7J7L8X6_9MAGN|nr:hypothetical protein GIB67_010726 [Kingdonia uniflora]
MVCPKSNYGKSNSTRQCTSEDSANSIKTTNQFQAFNDSETVAANGSQEKASNSGGQFDHLGTYTRATDYHGVSQSLQEQKGINTSTNQDSINNVAAEEVRQFLNPESWANQKTITNEDGVNKGNIWILWKEGIQDPNVLMNTNQHIIVLYMDCCLTFEHAKCLRIQRRELWDQLSQFSVANINPWLCLYNFNILLRLSERRRPNLISLADFADFLDPAYLFECCFAWVNLTWCNGQKGLRRSFSKLDRVSKIICGFIILEDGEIKSSLELNLIILCCLENVIRFPSLILFFLEEPANFYELTAKDNYLVLSTKKEGQSTPVTPVGENAILAELRANSNSEIERRATLEQQLASIQDALKVLQGQ